MNRPTDFLIGFGIALILHGVLVLGIIWFWTQRPRDLRPLFRGGEFSLAVTFVAEGDRTPDTGANKQTPNAEGRMTDDGHQTTEDEHRTPDDGTNKQTPNVQRPTPNAEGRMTDDGPGTARTQASTQGPADNQLSANQGSAPSAGEGDGRPQGVSSGVRMQSEIRPYYPLGARLRGEEGAVTVRVWVDSSGHARRCTVARSSGYPALDEAAVDAAKRARYVSARSGIWQAEAETTLTFRFQLTE